MMNIEIVTTKKKLTMSLLKQMKMASLAEMKYAMLDPEHRILGYVNAFRWNSLDIQVAIINIGCDWALVPMYETTMREFVSREQHPDGQEYHTHDVIYYYTYQKVRDISRTFKKSKDKEYIENCVDNANELVKFAKGNHIYL